MASVIAAKRGIFEFNLHTIYHLELFVWAFVRPQTRVLPGRPGAGGNTGNER